MASQPNHSPARPGVSVVIPSYNLARFLAVAVDSVLRQEYSPVEIIVVDDGSTDPTREVVAAYGERVRYVHQLNAGVSAARNTGIAAARFPFVAFLDADDEWLPGMLSRIMATFARLPEAYGLVACGFRVMDKAGAELGRKMRADDSEGEVTASDLVLMNRFAADTVVVKRSVLERAGLFDTNLVSSEDRDLWIRIAQHSRIHRLSDPLVKVRTHVGSLSTHGDRMKRSMKQVLHKARHHEHLLQRKLFFWARAHAFLHYQTAWIYFNEHRYGAALRDMVWSILIWPLFFNPHRLHENYGFRTRSILAFFRAIIRRSCAGRQPLELGRSQQLRRRETLSTQS